MRKSFISFVASLALLAGIMAPSLRAAEAYAIDAAHTSVGFSVKHLLVSNTKGAFNDVAGTIALDQKAIEKSSVKVTIKAASIDTANTKRDDHLRGADFFEVEKFPEITFVSKSVAKKGDAYEAAGTLTIKGVSKDVVIPFTLSGPVQDPWGGTRLGVEGSLTIKRKEFNVAMNNPGDAGIGEDVKIDLSVEAIQQKKK